MAGIQIRGLTKRFGEITAVDNLSFDIEGATVTGFLGPNANRRARDNDGYGIFSGAYTQPTVAHGMV